VKNPRASLLIVLAFSAGAGAQHGAATPPSQLKGGDQWRVLESPLLTHHVQLTRREDFLRAGEAYFGQGDWIIFQAIPVPPQGKPPDPFYSMYVAKLARDGEGRISGLEKPIRISPEGSANTCGWFHPRLPGMVIFGSTLVPPSEQQRSGFQVGTRKYVWMFPKEMEVVSVGVREIFADVVGKSPPYAPRGQADAKPVFSRPDYDAECSFSKDGRFILYAHVRENQKEGERADADLWVYDTDTGEQHELVTAEGYDGGPFFSPDGKRIAYRSDRRKDDLLQLFIADLKFDERAVPVGVVKEHQITDNGHVNWAPFWHPSGKFLVYGTSEIGHDNYEVFAIEADAGALAADSPDAPASRTLRRTRLTFGAGADVLPVFGEGGRVMMWTSQRGPMVEGEQKASSQLWVADFDANALRFDPGGAAP
jgi:TolB protein